LQRKRVGQLGKRDREVGRPATPKTLQRIQLFVLVIVGHDRSWVEIINSRVSKPDNLPKGTATPAKEPSKEGKEGVLEVISLSTSHKKATRHDQRRERKQSTTLVGKRVGRSPFNQG
jgi:hypothetical protein